MDAAARTHDAPDPARETGGSAPPEPPPLLFRLRAGLMAGVGRDTLIGRMAGDVRGAAEALFRALVNPDYRRRVATPWVKREFTEGGRRVIVEMRETEDLLAILAKYAQGGKVSKREQKRAMVQLADLAKAVPALGIFLLPGGALLLPLLARNLPWNILPSAFARPVRTRTKKGGSRGAGRTKAD